MLARAPRARLLAGLRRSWKRTLALLAVPFLVRTACFLELSEDPFFKCLFVDARTYHEMAVAVANRTFHPAAPFWQPPGYPLFLGGLYRLFGTEPNTARWIQIFLGSVSAWLVFLIARPVFGRRAAWIAWAAFAFYGPLVLYDLQLLNVNLGVLLLLLTLWLLLGARGPSWPATAGDLAPIAGSWRASWARTGLAGLVAGLATVTIGNLGILIPLGAAWLLYSHHGFRIAGAPTGVAPGPGGGSAPGAVHAAAGPGATLFPAMLGLSAFLFASALPIAAITAYNWSVSGEAVVISYNAGVNFWIGNNPDYESSVAIRPGRAWMRLTEEPRVNGYLGYRDQSRYFFAKSRRWIREHPEVYLRLLGHKVRLFLRGDEILRNQELYPFRERSRVVAALLWVKGIAFPWGLVLPLGAAGAVLALASGLRDRRSHGPAAEDSWTDGTNGSTETRRGRSWRVGGRMLLLAFALIYAASVIAFFVTGRYRLPVVPIALCFAGFAVDRALGRSVRSRTAFVAALGTALLAAAAANLGVPVPSTDFNSDAHHDLGYWYQEAGDRGMAKEHYERALEIDATNQEARNNLAGLLAESGDLSRAADLLVMVLVEYPHDARILHNLGSIRLQQGRPYDAGWCFAQILSRNPADARAQAKLAQAEEMAAELEERRLAESADGFLTSLLEASRLTPENEFLRERLLRLRLAFENR